MAKKQTKQIVIPNRFRLRWIDDLDRRSAAVRTLRQRYERLKTDCGADSFQKDILCQRVSFLLAYLESVECRALEGDDDQPFEVGPYAQAMNTVLGILRSLGLEKHAKKTVNLKDYIQSKTTGDETE